MNPPAPRPSPVIRLLAAGLIAGFLAGEMSAQSTTVDATSPGGVNVYSNGASAPAVNVSVAPPAPLPGPIQMSTQSKAESLGPTGGRGVNLLDSVSEFHPDAPRPDPG